MVRKVINLVLTAGSHCCSMTQDSFHLGNLNEKIIQFEVVIEKQALGRKQLQENLTK